MWKHIFGWQIGKCSSGSNTVYTKNTHGSDVNGSQKVLGEASLRWVNTNREKICQLRTGEAFHCIWFFQILSKIFKLSSRLNLPVMSGSFVVIADAACAHTRWTAWRENTCAQHKRVLLTFRIQSIATCHRLELYEFSFLGRFGQWGLLRKKNPNCHKYATFEASFLCFHGEK